MDASDHMEELARLKGRHVIHLSTGSIGLVAEFFDAGRYVSPLDGIPVQDPVVAFEDGNSFVARRVDAFRVLEDGEVKFHAGACEIVRNMTRELALFAKSVGMGRQTFETLFGAAVRSQLRAMRQDAPDEQAARTSPPDDAPGPPGTPSP